MEAERRQNQCCWDRTTNFVAVASTTSATTAIPTVNILEPSSYPTSYSAIRLDATPARMCFVPHNTTLAGSLLVVDTKGNATIHAHDVCGRVLVANRWSSGVAWWSSDAQPVLRVRFLDVNAMLNTQTPPICRDDDGADDGKGATTTTTTSSSVAATPPPFTLHSAVMPGAPLLASVNSKCMLHLYSVQPDALMSLHEAIATGNTVFYLAATCALPAAEMQTEDCAIELADIMQVHDGMLVTAAANGKVRLFHVTSESAPPFNLTSQLLRTFDIAATSVSMRSNRLFVASSDRRLASWKLTTSSTTVAAEAPDQEVSISSSSSLAILDISYDGTRVALLEEDGLTITIRGCANLDKVQHTVKCTKSTASAAFSSNAMALVTCDVDGESRLHVLPSITGEGGLTKRLLFGIASNSATWDVAKAWSTFGADAAAKEHDVLAQEVASLESDARRLLMPALDWFATDVCRHLKSNRIVAPAIDARARRRLALCGVALSHIFENKSASPEAAISLAPTVAWVSTLALLWTASMMTWASTSPTTPPWHRQPNDSAFFPLLHATQDADFLRLMHKCLAMRAHLPPDVRLLGSLPSDAACRVANDALAAAVKLAEAALLAAKSAPSSDPTPSPSTTTSSSSARDGRLPPLAHSNPWRLNDAQLAQLVTSVQSAIQTGGGDEASSPTFAPTHLHHHHHSLPVKELTEAILVHKKPIPANRLTEMALAMGLAVTRREDQVTIPPASKRARLHHAIAYGSLPDWPRANAPVDLLDCQAVDGGDASDGRVTCTTAPWETTQAFGRAYAVNAAAARLCDAWGAHCPLGGGVWLALG